VRVRVPSLSSVLDTATLRVAFGVIAICMLVLFYGVTYRSTRSAYSRWWCRSLACFVLSSTLFLFNGTLLQVAANPLGNTVAVLGAGFVWAAGRSLRGRVVSWPLLAAPASAVLLASLLDDPAGDVWTGGAAYLTAMGLLVALSSWELRQLLLGRGPVVAPRGQDRFSVIAMAVASGAIGIYYLLRCVVFVVVGPDHPVFVGGFGSQATTLLCMLLLVVVTFSMSALSHQQQTSELRLRATRDGLTGLLNRVEFLRAAQRHVDRGVPGRVPAVVVADLDSFKSLNDRFGHAAGDAALTAFADACREVLGPDAVVGRLGGDEFALLLPQGDRAEDVAGAVSRRYRDRGDLIPLPTISFGIAPAAPGEQVSAIVTHADIALYQAKAAGRDRAMRYDGYVPASSGGLRTAISS
jgi:diguanylate cyclase (GGDEF)-like protein